ncbi:hypothetical protein COV93_02205 [Candidatus Woesearchaeota archaeon CG11_big_fil_rev_8_21_14_0_20_43_8]|nr:MAG: hypothetical protein COV93_02205 [Candidatus Woesearchaeota archaeon CG11_big_fil_rev_8_21_14_0_20_43_8]PIO08088.1 MAG: hypothetical protein COT47_01260 [Candidatus Woesearchaeota archaeon CG08_land_8_20_14_0_20_43_7]
MQKQTDFVLIVLINFFLVLFIYALKNYLDRIIVNHYFQMFFWSISLLLSSLVLIKIFGLKIDLSLKAIKLRENLWTYIIALAAGIGCGAWFFWLGETVPATTSLIVLILDPILVAFAEEINHRGLILRSAEEAFGTFRGIFLQAIFFSIVHLNPRFIFLLSYFGFAILAGFLSKKRYSGSIYCAIFFHFITNITLYIINWIN